MKKQIEFLPIQRMYSLFRKNAGSSFCDQEMYEVYCRKFDENTFSVAWEKLCELHPLLLAEPDLQNDCLLLDTDRRVIPEYVHFDKEYSESESERECFKDRLFHTSISGGHIVKKVVVLEFAGGDATILTLTDGIGIDGESQEIMIRDLIRLYEERETERECEYSSFAEDYLEKLEVNKAATKAFWVEKAGMHPEGYKLSCEAEGNDGDIITFRKTLSGEHSQTLKKLAGNSHISYYAFLLAVYVRVLERYTDQKSFAISAPRSVRSYELDGVENTVGMLTDFIPLIASVREGDSLLDTAVYVQDYLWQVFDLGETSGMDSLRILQDELQKPVILKWTFTLITEKKAETELFVRKGVRVETGTADAEMLLMETAEGTELIFVIRPEKVNERICARIVSHFTELLTDLAEGKLLPTETEIPLCAADQRAVEFANNTENKELITNLSFAEEMKSRVRRNPDSIALINEEKTYTYRELDLEVSRLSSVLAERKKGGADRIAIFMEKSSDQVIAALAAVYAGTAYMPLETTLPLEDINWCLEQAGVRYIIASQKLYDKVKDAACDVVVYETLASDARDLWTLETTEKEERSCKNDERIAVIINTSGTTGRPKSVLLTEKGLKNCLADSPGRFEIPAGDNVRAIAVTNFCHDMALYDYLGIFYMGGSVVIPSESRVKDPGYLLELIGRYRVNFWNSVPAILEMLLLVNDEDLLSELRYVKRFILGGDWVRCSTVERVHKFSGDALVFSVGGPTETTIWNIYHRVTEEDMVNGFIPYGKPLANTKYHIFDRNERECPIGMPGIMYVEGEGVTAGYAGATEENAERYRVVRGRRMFRCGDKGLRLEDGSIRFLGREDNQVKINGKRIELGGIERKANELEGVYMNCCVLSENTGKIALFYEGTAEETEVRSLLEKKLVSYMLPSQIVRLDKIPLNHNGKADRKILREYSFREEGTEIDDSTVEGAVVSFLREILGQPDVSVEDNFYYLGGDSVSAMQLISRLYHKYRIEIDIYDILGSPEIADWMPLIKDKICEVKGSSRNLLQKCREFFKNEEITEDMSFMDMGGNESNLREFGEWIGLSGFQVLAVPWIDHWEALLN